MSTYVSLFVRMALKRSTGLRSFDCETLMAVKARWQLRERQYNRFNIAIGSCEQSRRPMPGRERLVNLVRAANIARIGSTRWLGPPFPCVLSYSNAVNGASLPATNQPPEKTRAAALYHHHPVHQRAGCRRSCSFEQTTAYRREKLLAVYVVNTLRRVDLTDLPNNTSKYPILVAINPGRTSPGATLRT
jgi:hypothetical protein